MRNSKLVEVAAKLARNASKEEDKIKAKVYAGLALEFLKLANADVEDYKLVSSLLPDLDEKEEEDKMDVSPGYWDSELKEWRNLEKLPPEVKLKEEVE